MNPFIDFGFSNSCILKGNRERKICTTIQTSLCSLQSVGKPTDYLIYRVNTVLPLPSFFPSYSTAYDCLTNSSKMHCDIDVQFSSIAHRWVYILLPCFQNPSQFNLSLPWHPKHHHPLQYIMVQPNWITVCSLCFSTSGLAHTISSAGNASSPICAFWNLTRGFMPSSDASSSVVKALYDHPSRKRSSFWISRVLTPSLQDPHFRLPQMVATVGMYNLWLFGESQIPGGRNQA